MKLSLTSDRLLPGTDLKGNLLRFSPEAGGIFLSELKGRFDGENYNIGLFDITLRPWPEMKKAVLRTAERVGAVHAGGEAPSEDRPENLPMIAY